LRENWGEQSNEVKRPVICVLDITVDEEKLKVYDEEWMDRITPHSVSLNIKLKINPKFS
jgi:hypothetical protein